MKDLVCEPFRLAAKYRVPDCGDIWIALNQNNMFRESFKPRCEANNAASCKRFHKNAHRPFAIA